MGRKARTAGIKLSVTVLLGLAGRERSQVHARETGRVLSAIDPESTWQLTPEGPPSILKPESNLHISFSHTHSHVAFAISNTGRIGCDIETDRPRKNFLKIAEQFFTETESVYLKTVDTAEAQKCFYQFWTLKEASLKARQLTIAGHLNDTVLIPCENRLHFLQKATDRDSNLHPCYVLYENLHLAIVSERDAQQNRNALHTEENAATDQLPHILVYQGNHFVSSAITLQRLNPLKTDS